MSYFQDTPVVILPQHQKVMQPLAKDDDALLLEIGDEPVIYRTLKNLVIMGLRQILIPVTEQHDALRNYLQKIHIPGLRIRVLETSKKRSEAELLNYTLKWVDAACFFVLTSEVLLNESLIEFFKIHKSQKNTLSIGVRQIAHDSRFESIIQVQHPEQNCLKSTVENWQYYACGIYLIEKSFFKEQADRINADTSIFDIADEVMENSKARVVDLGAFCSDWRTLDDFLQANFKWIEHLYGNCKSSYLDSGGADAPLRVGEVFIHPDAKVSPKAVLIGPVIIARGCVIEEQAIVQRSVIRRNVRIKKGAFVKDSIVNTGTSLKKKGRYSGRLVLENEANFSIGHFRQTSKILHDFTYFNSTSGSPTKTPQSQKTFDVVA
ncbi:MAG: NDP-sugar synthase [Calditrichaeota bacterium]|nr:MAG: NDP-sugar synthase [Calditrichota bacterium]